MMEVTNLAPKTCNEPANTATHDWDHATPGRRTRNHVSRCAELAAPAPGGRSSKDEKIGA
jgi:hypothetical protein